MVVQRKSELAVVLINPQNDVLSKEGAGWDLVEEVATAVRTVENLKSLIAGARQGGLTLVYAPAYFTSQELDSWKHPTGAHRLFAQRRMFEAKTWGVQIHSDLRPVRGDVIASPHKGLDAFATSDLDLQLRQRGMTSIALAGVMANLAVEATGRSAAERGYHVIYLRDAVAAAGWDAYNAAVEVNYPLIGHEVQTVASLLSEFGVGQAA